MKTMNFEILVVNIVLVVSFSDAFSVEIAASEFDLESGVPGSLESDESLEPELFDSRGEGYFIRGKFFRDRNYNRTIRTLEKNDDETVALLFKQCVDHSLPNCDSLWNQRYWQNWEHYKEGGPIFFMFGGEGDAEDLIHYHFENYAQVYNAVLIVLEHRFYGASFPTKNKPARVDDLKLLTSQQALKDGRKFVQDFKEAYNITEAKVVVFGGSYPGNLAAWARAKYPRVFNVAVASSAPLEARFDFPEYLETVSEVIKETDPTCFDRIKESFACMQTVVENGICQNSKLQNKTELPLAIHDCYNYNLEEPDDAELLFYRLQNYWRSNAPGSSSRKKCQMLNKQNNTDLIHRYGDFRLESKQGTKACPRKGPGVKGVKGVRGRSGGHGGATKQRGGNTPDNAPPVFSKAPANRNQDFMAYIRSKHGRDAHSWTWQTCYEFGYFQTPDTHLRLFGTGWGTNIDVERCQLAFPEANFTVKSIQSRIEETNERYKGKEFDGNCTIFVNGEWDPWHKLGINRQAETSAKNSVISIPNGEHCDDMVGIKKPSVKLAQAEIQTLIGKYLNDPNC